MDAKEYNKTWSIDIDYQTMKRKPLLKGSGTKSTLVSPPPNFGMCIFKREVFQEDGTQPWRWNSLIVGMSIPICYFLGPCVWHKAKCETVYLGHRGIIFKGFSIKHFVFGVAKQENPPCITQTVELHQSLKITKSVCGVLMKVTIK